MRTTLFSQLRSSTSPGLAPVQSSRFRVRRSTFRHPQSSILALPPALLAALLLTGCQVLTYTGPTGEKFMRGSLGAKTAIASLSVEVDTNGVRHLELKGYENDTVQALGAVTEAAVKAAVQGVKTAP